MERSKMSTKAKENHTPIKPETKEKKASIKNSLSRLFFVVVAIIAQLYLLYLVFVRLEEDYQWIEYVARGIALLLCIALFSMNKTPSMKMPWFILLLTFPVAGTLIYLIVGLNGSTRKMRLRFEQIDRVLFRFLPQEDHVLSKMEAMDLSVANQARYISKHGPFPVYSDSDIQFFPNAADALEEQKKELRKAEKFIFMEYHAIENLESFREIKEILAKKAQEGLDVRIFYDDMGSITFINYEFIREMRSLGIQCRVFNPVIPLVNLFLNNRDHRKITVIDGKVGFTGGYNLANEYFNITHPYGYWKDTGVKITGNAVRNLTALFLEMWNAIHADDRDDVSFMKFFPLSDEEQREPGTFVQPYGDSPLDSEHVGENVYLNIISAAEKYVWICTPYLIITDEMNRVMGLAAERGVDIRIMTPGIPDKRTIYRITRSHYQRLVVDGVRIFEYSPGFCHAKQVVCDDKVALCGTINFDFRSLYHHFENGVLFANCQAVQDMKLDFEHCFPLCREVTEQYRKPQNLFQRGWNNVLRLFSSLL